MKVIIVGAGISGLSTYLFLKKHLVTDSIQPELTIKIYEAYDVKSLTSSSKPISDPLNTKHETIFTPAAIGNAIGITKNGLEVLRRLDDDGKLLNKVIQQGCRIKNWKMTNARGWHLADVNMLSQDGNTGETDLSIMISRQKLWEALRDEVLMDKDVIMAKRVSGIVIGDGEQKSVINFSDGTSDEADLIIGADGLKSMLRRAMFQHNLMEGSSETEDWLTWLRSTFGTKQGAKVNKIDYITPHYEGLVGVGDFIPSDILLSSNHPLETMSIVFGPNGFFGCGYISSDNANSQNPGPTSAWWSTFSSATATPYAIDNNIKLSSSKAFDETKAIKELLSRHGNWKNPTIQAILKHVSETGLSHVYPTYTTPELPTWQQNGRAVLIGDAAHALQPSSGQGASQGLEDAEALALILKHYLANIKLTDDRLMSSENQPSPSSDGTATALQQEAIRTALEKFVDLRKPRIHAIYERTQKMSSMKADMGFLMEMLMYAAIWIMTLFHDSYNEKLINYDLPSEVEKLVGKD